MAVGGFELFWCHPNLIRRYIRCGAGSHGTGQRSSGSTYICGRGVFATAGGRCWAGHDGAVLRPGLRIHAALGRTNWQKRPLWYCV